MNGIVDSSGRALLAVEIRGELTQDSIVVDTWIDTGFTGELVLPQAIIDSLSVRQSGTVDALLADGSQIATATFTCVVKCFGDDRTLEVIPTTGDFPLLGVGLLLGLELHISYHSCELALCPPTM